MRRAPRILSPFRALEAPSCATLHERLALKATVEPRGHLSGKPTSMISLCQVGQGFPVALRRAPGCFTERIHHFAVVPLGAVPARNAEPDIHSLYRAVETVTED